MKEINKLKIFLLLSSILGFISLYFKSDLFAVVVFSQLMFIGILDKQLIISKID